MTETQEKIFNLLRSNAGESFTCVDVAEFFGMKTEESAIELESLHKQGKCFKSEGADNVSGKIMFLYSIGEGEEEDPPDLPGNGEILQRRNHIINYLINNGKGASVREIYYALKEAGMDFKKKHISNDLRQLLAMGAFPLSREDQFDTGTGKTISFWKWQGGDAWNEEVFDDEDEEEEEGDDALEEESGGLSIGDLLQEEDIDTLEEFLDYMSTDMLKKIRTFLENKSKEKEYRRNLIG
jgi:hypothetical protein